MAFASLLFSFDALFIERHHIAAGYGDYVIFYSGAQMVANGDSRRLYDLGLQRRYQEKFAVPIRVDALPFNHPAYELLWHIPLTSLNYLSAYIIWNGANLIFLIALARWFVPSESASVRIMCWLMVFGFYPVLVVILQGQDSILLTFLIGASIVALKKKKERVAGVLLAMASFKPQFVIPVALAWVCKPYWKAIGAWLMTITILVLISVAMVGIAGTQQYLQLLSWIDNTHYTINPLLMPNLRGLVFVALGPQFPTTSLLITATLTVGAFVYLVHLWRNSEIVDETVFEMVMALTVSLAILTSYHAYSHDLALLLLPALIVARFFFSAPNGGPIPILLFGTILLLWVPFPFTYGHLLQREMLAWGGLIIAFFSLLLTRQIRLKNSPIQA